MILDLYTVHYKLNHDYGEYGGGMLIVAARNHADAKRVMLADLIDPDDVYALREKHIEAVKVKMLVSNVSGFDHGVVDGYGSRE
jgi:hypothetical protein